MLWPSAIVVLLRRSIGRRPTSLGPAVADVSRDPGTYANPRYTTSTDLTLDEWLRRRLRQVRWKEWKRPRTRVRNAASGWASPTRDARQWAASRKGYWRIAGSPKSSAAALPNAYWTRLMGLKGIRRSLPPFAACLTEPPDADPHVRWCGRATG